MAVTVLLAITGLGAVALPGGAAAQYLAQDPTAGQSDGDHHHYIEVPSGYGYSPPPTTEPPKTAPPKTEPPKELPVTGVRSLGIAGIGLMLIGVGIVAWLLGGRRHTGRRGAKT